MKRTFHGVRASQRGVGLIEVMVALTVSLLLLAGALSIMYGSKLTYYENERVARTQEGGRGAFEMLLRDLRGSGFQGCAQPIQDLFLANNQLTNSASPLWNFTQPVKGYSGSDTGWTPALDAPLDALLAGATANSDVLVIRRVRPNAPQFRTTAFINPTDDIPISLGATDSIVAGTTLVINDCGGESFFTATNSVGGGGATTGNLTHVAGGAGEPGNVSNSLGSSFQPGAVVSAVDTVIYYVAPGANGPSLWRIVGTGAAEEVSSGVEAMRLQYGVDTNKDAVVDEYDDADVVDAAGNWGSVIAVRLAILVRSADANSPTLDTTARTLLDKAQPVPNDHYQRTLFTTTVTLRDQLP